MTNEQIKTILLSFVSKYSITSIILFGSRADGTNSENSDVDLILEFSVPISLLTLSQIKIDMEEALGLDVDVIHGPVTPNDIIEINNKVVLYAA